MNLMIDIAQRAIEAEDRRIVLRHRRDLLTRAYRKWQGQTGNNSFDRGSSEWDQMMAATEAEYAALEDAKRLERNARKRLVTAVRRYRTAA